MLRHSYKSVAGRFLILLSVCFFSLLPLLAGQYDVVIYGGTSSAIATAVQVKKMGKSVVVVSPDRRIGGLSSSGCGWNDTGKKEVIGGIARDFYHRVWRHYQSPDSWRWQKMDEYGNRGQGSPAIDKDRRTMWVFEPHVANDIFESLVKENELSLFREEWLNREDGVEMEEGRIVAINSLSGNRYEGKVFVDCSYEGDLMASAGVSYFVGREANAHYGESINGVQTRIAKKNQFINRIDPFQIQGQPSSGLLPGITNATALTDGSEDKRIQGYNFRLCLTKIPENRVPFSMPEGYDPSQYELLLRTLSRGSRHILVNSGPIPNGKTEINNHGSFSTDNIGMNYEYPDGSYEKRSRIKDEHYRFQMGYFYFLCNDPRVPDEVREEMSQWGLARDEFPENNYWPHQLYIREARRMVGDFVITEHEVLGHRNTLNSVGMSSFPMVSRNVQRYVAYDEEGNAHVLNEGDFQIPIAQPYAISYDAMVPRRNECINLLVPVCISASHAAYGSLRMEPLLMILGQSAGTAAALSIDANCSVQDLLYSDLKEHLIKDGQILEFKRNPRITKGKGVPLNSLGGVIMDGSNVELKGEWTESTSLRPFVGESYFHDGNGAKGMSVAKFSFLAPQDGIHEIKASYSSFGNRAGNVLFTVEHAKGSSKIYIDQRKPPPIGGIWVSLGSFDFKKSEQYSVSLSNEDTAGYVVADALQVIPLNTPAE